jgi:hypothetical protein
MAVREPTAASALYPHLPTGERAVTSQRKQSLSASMWPSQTPEAKAAEADQQLWTKLCKQNRDNLVRGLEELNRKIDQRLARERGSR